MIRHMLLAAASLAIAATPAVAAPCRGSNGKFVKCPTAPAKPVRCKAANGKFAKCGTSGAKPV